MIWPRFSLFSLYLLLVILHTNGTNIISPLFLPCVPPQLSFFLAMSEECYQRRPKDEWIKHWRLNGLVEKHKYIQSGSLSFDHKLKRRFLFRLTMPISTLVLEEDEEERRPAVIVRKENWSWAELGAAHHFRIFLFFLSFLFAHHSFMAQGHSSSWERKKKSKRENLSLPCGSYPLSSCQTKYKLPEKPLSSSSFCPCPPVLSPLYFSYSLSLFPSFSLCCLHMYGAITPELSHYSNKMLNRK